MIVQAGQPSGEGTEPPAGTVSTGTAATASAAEDMAKELIDLQQKVVALAGERDRLDAERADVEKRIVREEAEWGAPIKALMAELANLRQRVAEESRAAEATARVDVVRELLPVVDNVERAIKSEQAVLAGATGGGSSAGSGPGGATAGPSPEAAAAAAHYASVFARIGDVLHGFGLAPVPTVGEPFDYNVHEAIEMVPSDEHAAETVCKEHQRGYRMGDRLIRPALVAVSLG